jgi:hypothetical protein
MRGSLTAALSWLAGLGKADPLVPASEPSTVPLSNFRHYPGPCFLALLKASRATAPITFVTVSSGESASIVSLNFHNQLTQNVSGFA